MKIYKVKKGGSTTNLKATVVGYPVLDSNWVCVTELIENTSNEDPAIITRVAPKRGDNSAFDVNFTPTETTLEAVKEGKTYFWQTTMSNSTLTPPYSNTVVHKLEIEYKGG